VFTVQIHTPSAGWVSLPYMTYSTKRRAERFAADRRRAYPATPVRVKDERKDAQ
jgi:hypothetical protein